MGLIILQIVALFAAGYFADDIWDWIETKWKGGKK